MGSQHLKIDNIYFSARKEKYIATLINSYGDMVFNMTKNDTISGGEITDIGDNYVVFVKDDEEFTYDLIDEEKQKWK